MPYHQVIKFQITAASKTATTIGSVTAPAGIMWVMTVATAVPTNSAPRKLRMPLMTIATPGFSALV